MWQSLTDVSTFQGAVMAGLVSGLVFFIAGFFTGKSVAQKAVIKNKGNRNKFTVNSNNK